MQPYKPRPRELAQEYIEAYIREHALQPNECLPSERAMCQMWGFNRSTLRSAIARLVAEGRLYTRGGSGIRLSRRMNRTLQDLEGFSEHAHANNMKPESRLLSFSQTPCDRQLAARFKRTEGDMLYRIARLRIFDGIPLLLETAYIPRALTPGLEEHDLVHGSLFATLRSVYGLNLERGWEKTSITYVSPEEASYLNVPEDSPAFWIVSETYGDDGTLIEYCRSIGRADAIDMTSTLYWKEG